jgi:hypothetical protein
MQGKVHKHVLEPGLIQAALTQGKEETNLTYQCQYRGNKRLFSSLVTKCWVLHLLRLRHRPKTKNNVQLITICPIISEAVTFNFQIWKG